MWRGQTAAIARRTRDPSVAMEAPGALRLPGARATRDTKRAPSPSARGRCRLGRLDLRFLAPADCALRRLAECGGHEIAPAIVACLVLLHRDRERFRVGVMTAAGDLPRHARAWRATGDRETVAGDLLAHVQAGRWRADRGELVAERLVQRFEPVRHLDPGEA